MSIEEFLNKARVNPNEKIETNDGSFWRLKELLYNYEESKNL